MKRIGLVVAYDGTNYCGWQTQPNGITVQGVLNDTLSELLGEKIETIGASRSVFRKISAFSSLKK